MGTRTGAAEDPGEGLFFFFLDGDGFPLAGVFGLGDAAKPPTREASTPSAPRGRVRSPVVANPPRGVRVPQRAEARPDVHGRVPPAQDIPVSEDGGELTRQPGALRPRAAPHSTILASRGCSGSRSMSRPISVTRCGFPRSRAPSLTSKSRAASSLPAGGGSSHGRSDAGSRAPHAAVSSARGARSASRISGAVSGDRASFADSLHIL